MIFPLITRINADLETRQTSKSDFTGGNRVNGGIQKRRLKPWISRIDTDYDYDPTEAQSWRIAHIEQDFWEMPAEI